MGHVNLPGGAATQLWPAGPDKFQLELQVDLKFLALTGCSRSQLEVVAVPDNSTKLETGRTPPPMDAPDCHLRSRSASTGGSAVDGAAAAVAPRKRVWRGCGRGAVDYAAAAAPRKRRGRGCGRGRGLTHAGEPPFAELHPSWQAHRRLAARQGKAIRRELRDAVVRLAAAGVAR